MTNERVSAVLVASALAATLFTGCSDDTGVGGAGTGTISVQISGEELATNGFSFPTGSEVTIADGWQLRFDHVYVTVGRVWLAENPDRAAGDQSQMGEVVAEEVGPWAIDLAKPGSVVGAGGEGTAVPLMVFEGQNLRGGEPFATDQRYAFNYSTVAAQPGATAVNFAGDAAAEARYAEAAAGGCSLLLIGTATFQGTTCESSDPAYDFSAIPTELPFSFCIDAPAENLNCQNENNQGDPYPDESFQRGIPIKENDTSIAQLTMHLDHFLYADVEHEPRLFFDAFAAALVGQPAGTTLSFDMLAGLDPTGFVDGSGASLPWRVCDGSGLPAGTQRAYEAGTIPVGPAQDPSEGFRDYRDYVRYVVSAQGHLNGGEGICFTNRLYSSPP